VGYKNIAESLTLAALVLDYNPDIQNNKNKKPHKLNNNAWLSIDDKLV
jgi:hypothetical protein